MEVVGARAGNGINRTAGMEPILSRQGAGFDLEFLQRIRKWQWQAVVGIHIVVHAAIECVRISANHTPSDAEGCSVRVRAAKRGIGCQYRQSRTNYPD